MIDKPKKIELRPYQLEAIDSVRKALSDGKKRILVSLPTGAGKSIVAAYIAKDLSAGGNVLIVTHSKELVEQNAKAMSQLTSRECGVFCSGLNSKTIKEITFASIQTLAGKKNLVHAKAFDYLIVDEAHRINLSLKNSLYSRLFKVSFKGVVGLTATPYRKVLNCTLVGKNGTFEEIVYDVDIETLTREGYLSPLVWEYPYKIDTDRIKVLKGEFDQKALEKEVVTEDVANLHSKLLKEYLEGYRRIIIFCINIEHGELMRKALLNEGWGDCDCVSSLDPDNVRDSKIDDFKNGNKRAIINIGILTTGFDCPEVDCIVLLRPTASKVLFTQMIGRGTRQAENKKGCLILDFGGNVTRFGKNPSRTSKPCDLVKCANHMSGCEGWLEKPEGWEDKQQFNDRHFYNMDIQCPYEVLGVEFNDSFETIKKSYLNLLKKYHPDLKSASDLDNRKTQVERHKYSIDSNDLNFLTARLNIAWKVLKDPVLRRQYNDRTGFDSNSKLCSFLCNHCKSAFLKRNVTGSEADEEERSDNFLKKLMSLKLEWEEEKARKEKLEEEEKKAKEADIPPEGCLFVDRVKLFKHISTANNACIGIDYFYKKKQVFREYLVLLMYSLDSIEKKICLLLRVAALSFSTKRYLSEIQKNSRLNDDIDPKGWEAYEKINFDCENELSEYDESRMPIRLFVIKHNRNNFGHLIFLRDVIPPIIAQDSGHAA